MPRTETVANMLTRAKERADMENSSFISDEEWLRLLNVWTAQLWNHLVKADPDRYTLEQTLTGDGSTQDFAVPDDYYGTVGVDYISDSSEGIYIPLPRLFADEITSIQSITPNIPYGYTYRYNTTTPSSPLLRILPIPESGADCRHRYIVAPIVYPTVLSQASGMFVAGIAGFEEFVVIGMAIDARIKEESSVVQLRQSLAEMTAHLEEMAENRSAATAGHVTEHREGLLIDSASFRWASRWNIG